MNTTVQLLKIKYHFNLERILFLRGRRDVFRFSLANFLYFIMKCSVTKAHYILILDYYRELIFCIT